MKFIVSTQCLRTALLEAIELKVNSFEFNYNTSELVFTENSKLKVHVLESPFNNLKFTFERIQMNDTANFLSRLLEQPIVMELDEYEEEKLSVELSQFVLSF